jgi:hypothetical protein
VFVSCVCCIGSGLYDELISRSEESYRLCVCVCVCLIVCDIETSTMRRPRPELFNFSVARSDRKAPNGDLKLSLLATKQNVRK